jgi:hypothetical protein
MQINTRCAAAAAAAAARRARRARAPCTPACLRRLPPRAGGPPRRPQEATYRAQQPTSCWVSCTTSSRRRLASCMP